MDSPTIGFWGGMALLISSITGPGLTTIPGLFQEAGWFTPTVAFLLFGLTSAVVSLFLVETMSTIRGNENFQARVEYSTVAHLYLGNKIHVVTQTLLYFALQSVNISSIIISNQTMDSLLIRLFHKTCAVSFTEGWVCVTKATSSGSPFDSYILFSFGYLVTAAMVIPLSLLSLVQNIKFQLASVATLFLVLMIWIYIFSSQGFNLPIPTVGNNQSGLVGFVLSNFAFITTVPSFVNELSRSVSIHKTIIYPILVCIAFYIIIGLAGAASFRISSSTDILATLSASDKNKVLVTIVNILFPIAVLVTSVPVFAIVIRYNLVRGNFCSNRYAIVWASIMPWIFIIPFQTKGWLIMVMNWTSLIFGSSTNFIVPLLLYISSKIYFASTADTRGGDVFILHRGNSQSSVHSRPRSVQTILPERRSLGYEDVPRLTTNLPDEENILSNDETTTSPLVLVHPPPESPHSSFPRGQSPPKSDEEIDIADLGPEGSGSGLDPSSIPLRVVYSPAVSRNPSIGHSSHSQRPSLSSSRELNTIDNDPDQMIALTNVFPTSPSFESPFLSENQLHRRRNSIASNTEGRVPAISLPSLTLGPQVNNLGPTERTSLQGGDEEILAPPHFTAFRERRWLREIVVAKTTLAIVTLSVLGNLIYTIVQTAKGNNPLGS